MSNYNVLKSSIQEVIKQNGRKEITGQLLQQALIAMVNSLGKGYQFEGVATPETNPGSVDQKTFYIATAVGTYANMGGASLTSGQVGVFMWADSWTCVILDIPTKTYVDGQINTITLDVQGLANAIGELQTTVSGIGNTVSGLVTDVSGLQNNVQTINGQITQINTDLVNKVDKVAGMGLSHNDLTDALKNLIENAVQSAQIVQVIGDDTTKIISQAGIKAILEGYAKVSGHYPLFTAGAADNIVGDPIAVTDGYTEKPLALGPNGEMNEVADGRVVMNEVRGRAMAWNQLVKSLNLWTPAYNSWIEKIGDEYVVGGSYDASVAVPFVFNHINYVKIKVRSVAITGETIRALYCPALDGGFVRKIVADGEYHTISYIATSRENISADFARLYTGIAVQEDEQPEIIDLTLMFGAGNEPSTVEQAEAMLASRRRMKPYFPYNAGTLLGARLLGWSMPRTANLLNPTTKNARLVPYTNPGNTNNEYTIIGFDQLTGAAIQFTPDATGVAESVTIDAENHFVIPGTGTLEIVASGQDPIGGDMEKVCVYITWDGSMDNKVVAYEKYTTNPDSANVYYDDNGTMKQVFENGIMKAASASVFEKLYFDSISKKWGANLPVGNVNLGTIDYVSSSDGLFYRSNIQSIIGAPEDTINLICKQYTVANEQVWENMPDKSVQIRSNYIIVHDSAYSDRFVFKEAMNGVYLWFELATPVTLTDLYYKVGNDYVPMEEVFPDGFVGFGCNWATETLEEQADDANGQPTSITPETVENFTTDLKEAIKTLIDAQGDNVDLTVLRANLVAMCEALKQGGVVANYTISENATGGVFAFTFTPNA